MCDLATNFETDKGGIALMPAENAHELVIRSIPLSLT